MRRVFFPLVIIAALCISCAAPPVVTEFDDSVTLEHDYDAVWSAVIELFAERSWPIETIEKDSGIIVTERLKLNVGLEEMAKYADCGKDILGESRLPWTVKFNLFAKKGSAGETIVRINAGFRSLEVAGGTAPVDCASKGYLEAQLFEQLRELLE